MFRAWLPPLIAVLLAACAGTQRQASPHGIRAMVIATAQAQLGVPYRFGGAAPDQGFDCSGLVHYSYRRAGVMVPRTVARLRGHATPVPRSDLSPGDLLFFHTRYKGGHVGLYLGDGRFIHAPSNGKRVRIDRLDNPYWRRHFSTGGRLLDD